MTLRGFVIIIQSRLAMRYMFRSLSFALAGPILAAGLLLIGPNGEPGAPGPLLGQERLIKQDFNGDGIVDVLTTRAEGGSGFGGDFVMLEDGRTGQRYAYNTWGAYGQFVRLIPFDDELMKPENKGFKETLEGALFPEIPQRVVEGSLAWLVEAYSRADGMSVASDEALFSQKIRFEPRWTDGKVVPPASYYLVMADEKFLRSFPISSEDRPAVGAARRQAWLVYYAHNHQALELAAASGEVEIYKTAHGVVVREGGRSCWVFVNDEVLTDGPERLRWPSIKSVQLAEELVFIHHAGREEHLFVVDYRAGVAGRLIPDLFPASGGSFEVRDRRLFLRGGLGAGPIEFSMIREGLR